jgi:sarcosine oxidase subunit gamma
VTAESARSPLAGRSGDLDRLGVREHLFLVQVDVRVDAAATPLGFPRDANTWSADSDREMLWLGPDEWLVVGPRGSGSAIADAIERSLAGTDHSVTDVSANRVVLELSGEDRHELLAMGCGLDLHPRSWRDGMCAQTLLARVPVILQERMEGTRVIVRASFADYFVDWLLNVAHAGESSGA